MLFKYAQSLKKTPLSTKFVYIDVISLDKSNKFGIIDGYIAGNCIFVFLD